jgi:hypothetical protein
MIECCVCGHNDLVEYRRAGFEAYLQSLASSYLAPTAVNLSQQKRKDVSSRLFWCALLLNPQLIFGAEIA